MNRIDLEEEAPQPTGEELLRFQSLQEGQVLARFDPLVTRMAQQNAVIGEEEVAADVAAARAELDV